MRHYLHRLAVVLLVLGSPLLCRAEKPLWIWHDNHGAKIQTDEVRYFRKTFQVTGNVNRAVLNLAADDECTAYINGVEVARTKDHSKPAQKNVASELKDGENVIAIRAKNVSSDIAGVVVALELKKRNGSTYVLTDETWVSTAKEEPGWQQPDFAAKGWTRVKSFGKMGDKPWGDVFETKQATPAESLTLIPGFKAELLHSAEFGEGSWICMTIDQKGRLIIPPQADDQPLLRITLDHGKVAKIEPIPAPLHQAMGLLYAHKSLYVNGHGPNGTGLYRLIDSNHNDLFETNEVQFLKKFAGEGEHGYHAVVEGPDKMIYVINGNHTKLPSGLETNSVHKNFQEDFLLQREWDPGGHAVGILAPGGHIMRTDPEGKKWELLLAGYRNAYDFDFNKDGEIFVYDSDMEWDWGMPFYRPVRIVHSVPAGEYGWRSGSAKWPAYYPDSLPPTVDTGVGSPTGVKFGTKSKFPTKYKEAFYAMDWSYGRIFAIHTKPAGASYSATYEDFVKGKPLNVTDLEFGRDGAMYFITGGRGTQSGLYRVSYLGPKPAGADEKLPREMVKAGAEARKIRHKLESYYAPKGKPAVDYAWHYLGSDDRFLRYAARIVLEWQDVSLWRDRALSETNSEAALTALVGLARCSGPETQKDLLMALKKFPLDTLPMSQKLEKLRVISLSFIRQGRPAPELAKAALEKLERQYPSDNEAYNRELCQLLVYLESPTVITKTLALLDKAKTQEEQVGYAFYLRNIKTGWTLEQRKHYFEFLHYAQDAAKGKIDTSSTSPYAFFAKQGGTAERHPTRLIEWFKEAGREYSDGASYPKWLVNTRKQAVDTLSSDDRIALSSWIEDYAQLAEFKPSKERPFVQEWKMADIEPELDAVNHGRNFSNGKTAFNDAQCIRCHRMGNEGGSIGPELSALASKYTKRDVLESMIEPSKVISEQFQNMTIVKKTGDPETGRIVDEDENHIVIQPNLLARDRVSIQKSDVAERRPSKVSPMPEGLLNQFSKDEILDLLAYLMAGGKGNADNFKPLQSAAKEQ